MISRRRLAVLTTVLAAASIVPALSVTAETPQQADDSGSPPPAELSDVPPLTPVAPGDGQEVIHSWALAPAGAEGGRAGNRPELSYVADPGSVIEDAVTLYNLSNVPLVFRIYGTDAFNNDDGDFDLLSPEVPPDGAGSWVDMGAEQISVAPGLQVTIPITITVPEGAQPGDHAGALLASNAAVSTGEGGEQFTVDRRTGTRLYVRVNGPVVPELTIEDVQTDVDASINPFGGSATVTYTVENRGNVILGGTVAASIGGPFGIGEQIADARTIEELLPGESVTFVEEFDDVATLGVAVAEVEINPESTGDGAIEGASRQSLSLALPIGIILLLLAGVFGVLALRAYRRHRRPDDTAGGDTEAADDRRMEHQPT